MTGLQVAADIALIILEIAGIRKRPGGFSGMLLSGNGLHHRTLCPAVPVLSYIFPEPHARPEHALLLPSLITPACGLILMTLNGPGIADGLYPFFKVRVDKAAAVLWTAALFAAIALISFGLFLAAH